MNTPLPYLQLIQHFRQYIQPRDKRHLTVFSEIVSAILLSGSATVSHWLPFLSHRHCNAPSYDEIKCNLGITNEANAKENWAVITNEPLSIKTFAVYSN